MWYVRGASGRIKKRRSCLVLTMLCQETEIVNHDDFVKEGIGPFVSCAHVKG